MKYVFGNIEAALNINGSVECKSRIEDSVQLHTFSVSWDKADIKPGMELELTWFRDVVDIQYQWHSGCGTNRAMLTNWHGPVMSKISSGCPLHCFYNDAGMNRCTVALDDCITLIGRRLGVREEDATLECHVNIPLDATGRTCAYGITLRIDETERRYEDAIRAVAAWWEEKYPPMSVPDAAKQPLYSCWYSFHQQTIAEEIEEECARAAAIGMKTVIVDDGWQTGDNNRGYAYCGDWEVYDKKIPDMRAHVAKVHETGMKYMLWYSVPFIGKYSKAAERFAGKTLEFSENSGAYTLDPRYPEVRSYLTGIYVNALKEWDLDGFKLDFIDSFRMGKDTPAYAEGMDYAVLEDAVHVLMVDVRRALTAIKPDILIEFRQSYIGPVMREFGNMLRVGDCPNTTSTNRIGMVDLRLTSGNTAVHSDMLMWHVNDRVENAVMQIQNVLFSTVQLSVRLDRLKAEHKKAVQFWTDFMREELELLQQTPIYAESPQLLYPVVRAEKNGRGIIAAYAPGHGVKVNTSLEDMYIINASSAKSLILTFDGSARWEMTVCSCLGEEVERRVIENAPVMSIPVPEAGFIRLRKK